MNATLAPVVPPPGRIGFFCQSGALGIAILADAAARGLGLSTFVSAGNRADVSGNDLLQFWHGDDRTEVVLLYLEIVRQSAEVRPAGPGAGQDQTGDRGEVRSALPGHSRAGGQLVDQLSEAVVATLFEQSGVIRTPRSDRPHSTSPNCCPPSRCRAGNRVGIVGNSSALGVLAVDFCLDAGLLVAAGRAGRPRGRASARRISAEPVRAAV